jgi:hypothetical protein
MAITQKIVLNKLDINVQNPSMEVVKRVSFYEGEEELNRTHISIIYSFENEENLYVSESQYIQDTWTFVSASFIETSGSIS